MCSNTVERRMDLASFFCMIGRHGPAVALAAIAMVSVLAGFIIYRTVRGKRRKATAAAEDGDSKSREADTDASVIQQRLEESQSSVESTDISGEVSEVKEAADLIQSDLNVRHRHVAAAAAAAEKTPPPYCSPQSDIKVPDDTSDATQEVLSDADMVPEDVSGCHQGEAIKDVLEEFKDEERCMEEAEPIDEERHEEEEEEEEEEVLKAEWQQCEDEEESRGNGDDGRLDDQTPTKDMDNPDPCSISDDLSPEEEEKHEDKETESSDEQLTSLQPQCDQEPTPIQGNDWDEDKAGEEDITEDRLSELTDAAKDTHCPHLSSFSQDEQSDQTKEDKAFSSGAAPVTIEDIDPPMCPIRLSLCDKANMSPPAGEESGISSMNVSPVAGSEFDVILEDMIFPAMDCENDLSADDAAPCVITEDTAGMDSASLAANEDMFGHEIEDSYHRAVDQFAAQIADSDTSFIDEPEKQPAVSVFVEATEEKAAGNSGRKEEMKEEEEEYEKTEISIMEATMDHNEWIMDSNYQALPWMNLCTTSFAQDGTKSKQRPAEECQSTDVPCSAEVKQSSDETTENSKKVVAVPPMPQNVNVTFRVHYFTDSPYQTVAVTGSQQELGNWKGFVPLERAKDGHWAAVVSLPTESHVEWKFVVVDKGEVCRWEECGNRLLDTGFGDDLLVHEYWGRL